MKKTIAIAIVLVIALSLFACTGSEKKPAETANFKAGFGRVSITPAYSVPLAGYGNTTTRMSQGYVDQLYATCVALQDAKGETVLLYTCDVINIHSNLYKGYVEAISKATGVKEANIIVAGTHTHSGPDQGSSHASIKKYKPFFQACLVEAGKAAMKDLSPAVIKTGSTTVEGMNFVRHYLMNDGTYFGDNFGNSSSGYAGHEREADKQMQLVQLVRTAKDKQSILMVNWQAHAKVASTASTPEGNFSRGMMSADYIGSLRENVEEQTGMLMAYYLGASGNLNAISNIAEEQKNVPQDVKVYGKQLSQYVLDALPNLKAVEAGSVVVKKTMYTAQIDHTEDHLLRYAQPVAELWAKTNTYSLCKDVEHGIMSPYHATSIVSRAKTAAIQREMEINAISIGSIGFTTAPYEMFCQNGQAVKEGSPFETTFVITCCNGSNAYIAADAAFEYGAYEVHNRTFVRGTAEAVQDELIAMLNQIAG